mgnify:CR=1 FL=1
MLAIEIIDYGHGSAADRNNNAKLLGTGGLALHIYDPALLIFILLRGMLKSTSRSRDLVMELLHLAMEQPLIWSYDQHTKADSVCFFFSLMRYGSLIPLQRMLNNGCRGTTLEATAQEITGHPLGGIFLAPFERQDLDMLARERLMDFVNGSTLGPDLLSVRNCGRKLQVKILPEGAVNRILSLWDGSMEHLPDLAGDLMVKSPYYSKDNWFPVRGELFKYCITAGAHPSVTKVITFTDTLHKTLVKHVTSSTSDPELIRLVTGMQPDQSLPDDSNSHIHILPIVGDGEKIVGAALWLREEFSNRLRSLLRRELLLKYGPESMTLAPVNCARFLANLNLNLLRPFAQLAGCSCVWRTLTPFVPPRFVKKTGANSIEGQIAKELRDLGITAGIRSIRVLFLENDATILNRGERKPKVPIRFSVKIEFARLVTGPIMLGYGSRFGMGMFYCVPGEAPSEPQPSPVGDLETWTEEDDLPEIRNDAWSQLVASGGNLERWTGGFEDISGNDTPAPAPGTEPKADTAMAPGSVSSPQPSLSPDSPTLHDAMARPDDTMKQHGSPIPEDTGGQGTPSSARGRKQGAGGTPQFMINPAIAIPRSGTAASGSFKLEQILSQCRRSRKRSRNKDSAATGMAENGSPGTRLNPDSSPYPDGSPYPETQPPPDNSPYPDGGSPFTERPSQPRSSRSPDSSPYPDGGLPFTERPSQPRSTHSPDSSPYPDGDSPFAERPSQPRSTHSPDNSPYPDGDSPFAERPPQSRSAPDPEDDPPVPATDHQQEHEFAQEEERPASWSPSPFAFSFFPAPSVKPRSEFRSFLLEKYLTSSSPARSGDTSGEQDSGSWQDPEYDEEEDEPEDDKPEAAEKMLSILPDLPESEESAETGTGEKDAPGDQESTSQDNRQASPEKEKPFRTFKLESFLTSLKKNRQ